MVRRGVGGEEPGGNSVVLLSCMPKSLDGVALEECSLSVVFCKGCVVGKDMVDKDFVLFSIGTLGSELEPLLFTASTLILKVFGNVWLDGEAMAPLVVADDRDVLCAVPPPTWLTL